MIKKSNNSLLIAKETLSRLSLEERIQIFKELQNDLYPILLEQASSLMRSKAKTTSMKKISQIVKKVRKKLYEREISGRSWYQYFNFRFATFSHLFNHHGIS